MDALCRRVSPPGCSSKDLLGPANNPFGEDDGFVVLVFGDGFDSSRVSGLDSVVGKIHGFPDVGRNLLSLGEEHQQYPDIVGLWKLDPAEYQDGLHGFLGRLLAVKAEILPEHLSGL